MTASSSLDGPIITAASLTFPLEPSEIQAIASCSSDLSPGSSDYESLTLGFFLRQLMKTAFQIAFSVHSQVVLDREVPMLINYHYRNTVEFLAYIISAARFDQKRASFFLNTIEREMPNPTEYDLLYSVYAVLRDIHNISFEEVVDSIFIENTHAPIPDELKAQIGMSALEFISGTPEARQVFMYKHTRPSVDPSVPVDSSIEILEAKLLMEQGDLRFYTLMQNAYIKVSEENIAIRKLELLEMEDLLSRYREQTNDKAQRLQSIAEKTQMLLEAEKEKVKQEKHAFNLAKLAESNAC